MPVSRAALMRRSDSPAPASEPPQQRPRRGADSALAEIMASRTRPKPLLASLNQALLGRLPGLLGRPGSGEVATARVATVIRLFVLCAPPLKPLMLQQLEDELHRWGECWGVPCHAVCAGSIPCLVLSCYKHHAAVQVLGSGQPALYATHYVDGRQTVLPGCVHRLLAEAKGVRFCCVLALK